MHTLMVLAVASGVASTFVLLRAIVHMINSSDKE